MERRVESALFLSAFACTGLAGAMRAQTTRVPPSPSQYERFGTSTAIDGRRMVVGARYHAVNGIANAGCAYVYERVGSNWVLGAQLTASDADVGDGFGCTVAVEGDTILVGADSEGTNGRHFGATYVFARSGTQWVEQQKLRSPQPCDAALFGRALDLSGDTAVIAAPSDSTVSDLAGSVHVFVRNGTTWTLQTSLAVTDSGYQADFGTAVAIDGDTLLASTPREDGVYNDEGSVHVFQRTGSTWIEQPKFRAPFVPGDLLRFGAALDLEGDRCAVGTFALPGRAYIFERTGSTWTQRAVLYTGDPLTAFFGYHIDLDGDRLAVGAFGEAFWVGPGVLVNGGAAYVYAKSGAQWRLAQRLISPAPESNGWFSIVALDGATLAVGEPYHGPIDTGAVHVYDLGELGSYCTPGTTTHGCAAHLWIDGVASISSTAPARLTASDVEGQTTGLIFLGAQTITAPWAPGSSSLLCVAQPLARIPPESPSNAPFGTCHGTLTADVNGYLAAHAVQFQGQPVLAGTTVRAQAWFRDPPAPKGSNLSDALTFTFAP